MEKIILNPIGIVRTERKEPKDDFWGNVISVIELNSVFSEEALAGLSDFSHIDVVYHFNKADPKKIILMASHPRENPQWPRVGIFAQRKKDRPNHIGISTCGLIKIDKLVLTVQGLDAIDGTPVLDIKPCVREFIPPLAEVRQPKWITELMKDYFA